MTPTATAAARIPAQLARLGQSRWLLWREVAVRGAGFPARRVLEICDDQLAAAADRADANVAEASGSAGGYAAEYAAAQERLTAAIRRTAAERRFREAVTWQNPGLVRDCLDKAAAGERRNVRGRNHELTIATYLQRYCLKNDTVGFFGPVGWARLEDDNTGLSVALGPEPLARRTTYFEGWAIDALAEVIAARQEVWPWLRPRVAPSAAMAGWALQLPFRKRTTLSANELRVLGLCDGSRTVREIVGEPPDPDTVSALLGLNERGAVEIGLAGTFAERPERELATRLEAIGDAEVRERALEPLRDLVAAKDAVSAAAGNPGRLLDAIESLTETFEKITGARGTRRPGGNAAGRTLVYEDAIRAADISLGRLVTDELAKPLGLVLDSALWVVNSIAERYVESAQQLATAELARSGTRAMSLMQLLMALLPELGEAPMGRTPKIVEDVVAEFQQRWRRVLDLPADDGRGPHQIRVSADSIAARLAHEFATGPPLLSAARWYSPDVMFAAGSAPTTSLGDVEFVLGELHCAANSLESQLFASQHPEPARLRDAAAATGLDGRVIIIQRTDGAGATTRMSRADELMLPTYTYLCMGAEGLAPQAGAKVLSVMDLVVQPAGSGLVVRHRVTGQRFDFLEVIGEPFCILAADAFRPFAGRHCPRVTIDRLVVSRESWTFAGDELAWAFIKDECQRYLQARRWRADHGLPGRGFVRVPVERKPMAVDFRSLPLVNLLAKSIRKTAEANSGPVTITEMLPDLDRLWMRDAADDSYTTEFRFVATLPC